MCHIITSLSKKELFIHVKFDLEKIKQQIAVYRGDVFAQTKSLLQWEKVDFAKQKTDEVSLNAKQLLIHRCGGPPSPTGEG